MVVVGRTRNEIQGAQPSGHGRPEGSLGRGRCYVASLEGTVVCRPHAGWTLEQPTQVVEVDARKDSLAVEAVSLVVEAVGPLGTRAAETSEPLACRAQLSSM